MQVIVWTRYEILLLKAYITTNQQSSSLSYKSFVWPINYSCFFPTYVIGLGSLAQAMLLHFPLQQGEVLLLIQQVESIIFHSLPHVERDMSPILVYWDSNLYIGTLKGWGLDPSHSASSTMISPLSQHACTLQCKCIWSNG